MVIDFVCTQAEYKAAFRPSTTIDPARLIVIMLFRISIDEPIHALSEKIFSPKNLGGYEDIACLFHILGPSSRYKDSSSTALLPGSESETLA